jgi:hypothetical protein
LRRLRYAAWRQGEPQYSGGRPPEAPVRGGSGAAQCWQAVGAGNGRSLFGVRAARPTT